MNEQIFFTIPQAAQFLFPDRTRAGAQKVLRRMVREKEIPASYVGRQPYISRATLQSYGVNSLSTASPALRVVEEPRVLYEANDETGAS